MDKDTINKFIRNYSTAEFDKIKFDWNGKHAEDFEDKNYNFRLLVSEYLVDNFSIANDKLIRDLYIEWSKCSKENWSVYYNYHLFAQQILNRGGTEYLSYYLTGALYSFDTVIASGRVVVSDEMKKEFINYAKDQLRSSKDTGAKRLWEFALQRFNRQKENA